MHHTQGSVLVVVTSGEKLVAVRQPNRRLPILWKLPGGRVRLGETPKEAAVREVFEETGVKLTEAQLVELSVTPQPGYVGEYMQYLFEATVPTEALARHTAGLVDCVDPEGVRLESTCFDRRSVERMPDFMPKHLDMLQKANSKADA